MFSADSKKGACGLKKFGGRDTTVAVLLNRDKRSPNANTISLFINGQRACQPQALPEGLQGKALYPAVTFRSMTLHMNLGEEALEPLPFNCRMIGAADQSDVDIAPRPEKPKDGKYEVLCPVGLPEEGLFDWLDMFLKKNKKYTEVSDRAMQAWCEKSGIVPKGKAVSSRDKPLDKDLTAITSLLRSILPLQQRDVVLMELRDNLIKDCRVSMLQLFPASVFKRIAVVAVGDPTSDFKKHTLALVKADKQEESDKRFKLEFQKEKAQWLADKRKKEAEKVKKKQEA